MSDWLKFVIALAAALVLMLAFRALAFTVYTVDGKGLQPLYIDGDRLLVNRWSYGLRVDGNGMLPYSRMLRKPVTKGDIVVFDLPGDSIEGEFIARCKAVPGYGPDEGRYDGCPGTERLCGCRLLLAGVYSPEESCGLTQPWFYL